MRPCLLACLSLLLTPPLAAAPLTVTFEPSAVAVSGITPKGQAVWFSIAREVSRNATAIVPRIEILPDDDGDGTVRLELARDVPRRSIWFAVDLATGETAVATPAGFPKVGMTLPAKAVPAALDRLELERQLAYLVVVRPGVGAWMLRVGDGGASDEDGEPDGTLRAALTNLSSLKADGPPPPERFSPKDVVLIIDPNRMESSAVRIGG